MTTCIFNMIAHGTTLEVAQGSANFDVLLLTTVAINSYALSKKVN